MLERYKSWSAIKKQLEEMLCDSLRGRITYFLTRYHKVHDAYGRASIRLDGKELICFSWIEMYHQENAVSEMHSENPNISFEDAETLLKPVWDENCTFNEMDFINSVQKFFHMQIQDALESDDYIVKILAILDRRAGKRTLKRINEENKHSNFPNWVQSFYALRFNS